MAMLQVFKAEGLDYCMDGLTGSTMDSHRLITWAGSSAGRQAQDALVEQLFLAYFTQVSVAVGL